MASKNYIKTTELAKLTGRPYNEILQLANTGVLPGYKTRRGRWRLKVDAAEEYFGIQIDNPIVADDTPISATPAKALGREDMGKLICGHTARKYLKCSKAEFENLVNQGHIQAYRDEYMRWKVSKDQVINQNHDGKFQAFPTGTYGRASDVLRDPIHRTSYGKGRTGSIGSYYLLNAVTIFHQRMDGVFPADE